MKATDKLPDYFPAALRAAAIERNYPKGARLFHFGERVRATFLVLEGEVRLCRFSADGKEIILQRAVQGESFAEAALDAKHYHCHAIAVQPTRVIELPAEILRELLETDAHFARQWTTLLAWQLRRARSRLERQSLKTARARIIHYLVSEGTGEDSRVTISGTIKEWADDLGLTHETLYRTLAAMEKERTIARDGAQFSLSRSKSV
jgi:CRP-like cAMP-binding protein